jgi:type I restriction-modification system DNA methylase subunit
VGRIYEDRGERDINPAKLREVVETFSDPRYRLGLADVQPDFLGRAYEYLLRKFAEGSGQSAGEFFTPTEVGFLMARIMRPKGRAAVVLDTGAVTRGSGSKNEDKERNIRKWFVDRDLIDGVILLPDNLFYNTSAAGVIAVLSRRKPAARKDKIVLLNATRRVQKGRPKNFIPENDIRPLAAAYLKGEPIAGEIAVITRQQAEEADYNLSPSRWVGRGAGGDEADLKDILDRFDGIIATEADISRDFVAALAKLRELV